MNTLASFSQSSSCLRAKIALLTFYGVRYSKWSEKTIVTIEYLQLISQCLLISLIGSDESSSHDTRFTKGIIYFFKLVNPSSLMSFQGDDSLTDTILLIVLSSMVLKYMLAIYIICVTYWSYQSHTWLLIMWKFIYRIQSRILCFLTTPFWTDIIIDCSQGIFITKGMGKAAIIAICSILIIMEYLFSFLIELQLCYVLPTKNFLASRSYGTVIITLSQKCILQFVQIVFQEYFRIYLWISSILNLMLSLIRSYQFYTELPIYNFRALLFQGDLLSAVISLNFVHFIQIFLQEINYQKENMNFVVIAWLMISIFACKLSREYLQKLNIILTTNSDMKGSLDLLLYKVFAQKQLQAGLNLPHKGSKKQDITYLLDACNLDANGNKNRIYLEYFELLAVKFPHKTIIKLHIAKLCSKDPELYPKIMNVITKITRKKWSHLSLTASLLQYEIQKTLMKSCNASETSLDLLEYIKNQLYIEKLIKNIQTQIELKIAICNNILGEKSNIGLIFNNAHLISKYKAKIQNQIDLLPKTIPNYFIEPELICAAYYRILDISPQNFEKYNNLYLQKRLKYEKSLQEATLNNENLYQDTNIFLIMSGEKSNIGQIVYSSHSIAGVCGRKHLSYHEEHISTLFIPSFQSFYQENFRQIFETEKGIPLNHGQEVFLHHKDGHIIHAELYVKIHPYLTKGLYLDVLIRPINSSKEYLIISGDGIIKGATKALANDLGIKNFFAPFATLPNVRLLSEELWRASQTFNMILKVTTNVQDDLSDAEPNSLTSFELNKGLEMKKTFNVTRRIQLARLTKASLPSFRKEEKDKYLYDCSVSTMSCGQTQMKLITLEKVLKDENQQDSECISIEANEYDDEEVYLTELENIESPEKVSNKRFVNACRRETNLTTHANLLTPTNRSQANSPLLFSEKEEEEENTETAQKPRLIKKKTTLKDKIRISAIHLNPASSNPPNPSSQNKTASITFKTAIAINFHPKSFTTVCLMFYAVILITFFSQIGLMIVSNNTMNILTVKKNVQTNVQLRNSHLILIAISARVAITTINSTNLDQGTTIYSVPMLIDNLKNHSLDMKNYNQEMIDYTSFLGKEIQNEFFEKDVNVHDYEMDRIVNSTAYRVTNPNSTGRYITQFEVINELIDKIYNLKSLAEPESKEALTLFYWIRYNSINDFLYKYEEIVSLLAETIQNEKEELQLIIMLCLIIIPILLVGIILMVTTIIWRQYLTEKKNMQAFIRLKSDAVKEILKDLNSFKKNLENKKYTEYQYESQSVVVYNDSFSLPQDEPQRHIQKKRCNQVVDYTSTRTRYAGYFLKVTCYVLVLIGIALWNFISAKHNMSLIYKKQSQIDFAYSIFDTTGLQFLGLADSFESNNTALIEHSLPKSMFYGKLYELKILQSQAPEIFRELDHSYDPQIESLLFENDCSQYNFKVSVYSYYCNLILNGYGQRINLLSSMTYFEYLMGLKIEDYENCDKSTMNSLYTCAYLKLDYFNPAFVLFVAEVLSLANVLTGKLEQCISRAYHQQNIILVIFSVSLIGASLLIWYQILVKLKEGYNDFKKVLQLFPPILILSSPQLKTFLLQHSNQIGTENESSQK